MTWRDEIVERLQRDGVPYEEDEGVLRVPPASADGFEVALVEGDDGSPIVYFEGWHESEPKPESALDLFGLGLSTACRLRVLSTGGKDHTWTMEWWDPVDKEWIVESTTALIVRRFVGKRRERVLQNRWIPFERIHREDAPEGASGPDASA